MTQCPLIIWGIQGAIRSALAGPRGAASQVGNAWKGTAALISKWAQAGYVALTIGRIAGDVVSYFETLRLRGGAGRTLRADLRRFVGLGA